MANSKYDYVKTFEQPVTLLPNTYLVVRLDGRGFHKLSARYGFQKPNDRAALDLMNAAAVAVMEELPDIKVAYGISDEFSFVFDRSCNLFQRRESKILTTVVSTFTSYYVHLWPSYFPSNPLSTPMPSFDGRVVQYPSLANLRDYMSWRQVDCHINNLYNTTFWALVERGKMDATKAETELKGTLAADKNEILFSRFKINYNNEPELFKKGSVIHRDCRAMSPEDEHARAAEDLPGTGLVEVSKAQAQKGRSRQAKDTIRLEHIDIIKNDFWEQRPWLLSSKVDRPNTEP